MALLKIWKFCNLIWKIWDPTIYRHPAHTGHGLNASCWFVRRCIQAIAWMHPGFGGNIQAWPECIPPFYYVNVWFWPPKCALAWINPDAFRPWPECTPFTFRHLLLICPAMHSGHCLNTPGDGSTYRYTYICIWYTGIPVYGTVLLLFLRVLLLSLSVYRYA